MSRLFSEIRLRDITFANRIGVSPMRQYSCDDGFANDWHSAHLAARAVGGAGLVFAVKKQFGRIEKTVGVLLAAPGVAFLTGGFQSASLWLIETFPQFGEVG